MKSIVILVAFATVVAGKDIAAVSKLTPNNATNNVSGTVTLFQRGNGPVVVTGIITGLKPGKHGFHVHEFGNITNGCDSAGEHYNPTNQTHGAPTDYIRHVGDLGNVETDDNGVTEIYIVDDVISLTGPYSIIGRSFVVHVGEDDYGRGGTHESCTGGSSGQRASCGVIGIGSP
ncbi:uncharacterized protein LOC103579557 [Microplitis demolitor]|uniref:uncharacterized protein LOC103579557 n=1 Tax=Microplitis demolitor TaxID=69319 RepID=UPI0004CCE1B0|nr:uncharacterized protein LOC103579557 [Microplitis demolitor]